MKKRITAIILVLCLALAMMFAGCGKDKTPAQPDGTVTAVSSADAQPEILPDNGSGESVSVSAETGPENGTAVSEVSLAYSSSGTDGIDSVSSTSGPEEVSSASSSSGPDEVSSVSLSSAAETVSQTGPSEEELSVTEDGEYTDKDHVALYIHEFGHLPSNFVTKNKAMDAGWDSRAGNLNTVLPGKSIGGSRFGNYEGLLPEKNGRKYYECDIDFNPDGQTSEPAYRNEKRIIYSNDGLVFYTEDHYKTFEQLY